MFLLVFFLSPALPFCFGAVCCDCEVGKGRFLIGWIASGCRHWVYGCVVWAVRDAVAILQYERRGLLFLPCLEEKGDHSAGEGGVVGLVEIWDSRGVCWWLEGIGMRCLRLCRFMTLMELAMGS